MKKLAKEKISLNETIGRGKLVFDFHPHNKQNGVMLEPIIIETSFDTTLCHPRRVF